MSSREFAFEQYVLRDTVIVDNRGFEITIPRGSEFYIADVRTLCEFTFGDEEPDLRGAIPEAE